ncbi:hypothetical protein [Gemmatimonas sp.]|uniref:hypothetical protein n=1 Tax=Gemmatimonas sp. TaxID=1962908 RepID=UPI0035620ECA
MWRNFISAVLLQFVAQRFLGVWGAAVAGVLTGVLFRQGGAIRAGALSAAMAAAVLLVVAAERGAALMEFAAMIGRNFSLPGWAVLVATLVLPALQAGGFAGLVSRVLRTDRVAIS